MTHYERLRQQATAAIEAGAPTVCVNPSRLLIAIEQCTQDEDLTDPVTLV